MGVEKKPDFSGYATKAGLRCTDGRVIMPDAFAHQDGEQIPLVWQHRHDDPKNVLGHAILEKRDDGMYARAYFNTTDPAKHVKESIVHGDLKFLSIFANQLKERSSQVFHGMIRELSVVLAGGNPGALIDNITLAHGDDNYETLNDEAVIYTGLELYHGDGPDPEKGDQSDDDDDDPTVQDVFDSMTPEQQQVAHYMVGAAVHKTKLELKELKDDKKGDKKDQKDLVHDDKASGKDGEVSNVFETHGKKKDGGELKHDALSHADAEGIWADAMQCGSLKKAVQNYALAHGIDNLEVLFPDAKSVDESPQMDMRRMGWVGGVLEGTKHTPFSRIKSTWTTGLTQDEARARGYIKGNLKKEEWFGLTNRITTPTTVYKKQSLDRDDIIDVTTLDIVPWLKAEMQMMLREELARAILVGDGREAGDEDKIKDPVGTTEGAGIRSILNDHDMYAATVNLEDNLTNVQMADRLTAALALYKGSGGPTLYTTLPWLTRMLQTRDEFNHRLWPTAAALAAEIGVSSIVTIEVLEEGYDDLVGIIVNLSDYTIGTDKGGEVTLFDDFDIDFNKWKYLIETRLSGALTKIRSALVLKLVDSDDDLATPVKPDFDGSVVTVATTTGVVYKDQDDNTLTTGSPTTLAAGEEMTVFATPDSGYYFADNVHDEWSFKNRATS